MININGMQTWRIDNIMLHYEKLVTNVAILHNSDRTVLLKELFVTIEKDC